MILAILIAIISYYVLLLLFSYHYPLDRFTKFSTDEGEITIKFNIIIQTFTMSICVNHVNTINQISDNNINITTISFYKKKFQIYIVRFLYKHTSHYNPLLFITICGNSIMELNSDEVNTQSQVLRNLNIYAILKNFAKLYENKYYMPGLKFRILKQAQITKEEPRFVFYVKL